MKKEIKLKGTPKDLALKLDDLSIRRKEIYKESPVWFIPGQMGFELPDDVNPIYLSIYAGKELVYTAARKISDNRTILILDVTDEVWKLVRYSWGRLIRELDKEDWTEDNPTKNMPEPGAGDDLWFRYYHGKRDLGYKYTLEDLADDMHIVYSTARKKHQTCYYCHQILEEGTL